MRRKVCGSAAERAGFTLLELLTALTVVSVSVGILVMLLGRLGELYREAELRAAASDLALSQVSAFLRAPSSFRWRQEGEDGRLVAAPVGEEPSPDGYAFQDMPESLSRAADFRWQAFARTLENREDALELTVVVVWQDRGRARSFALTTPLPAGHVMQSTGGGNHAG